MFCLQPYTTRYEKTTSTRLRWILLVHTCPRNPNASVRQWQSSFSAARVYYSIVVWNSGVIFHGKLFSLNLKYSNKNKPQEGAERFQQKVTSVAKNNLFLLCVTCHSSTVWPWLLRCIQILLPKALLATVTDASGTQAEEVRDFQSAASTQTRDGC